MPPTSTSTRQRAPKVAVIAAQQILNEITANGYGVGHRLPAESVMQEQVGVARATLREAIRLLEHHGVVSMKPGPGGGPIVQDPGARDLANTFGLLLQIMKVPVSAVLELRRAVEPELTALAAARITTEQIQVLNNTVEAMETQLDDITSFVHANLAFHEGVARASSNALFATIVEALDLILTAKMELPFSARSRKAILEAHRDILDAITKRDPDAARTAMAAHLTEIEAYLESHNAGVLSEGFLWQDQRY